MIWDEALFELTLIRLGRITWKRSEHPAILVPQNEAREGLKPENIALSCHEAASRWRTHFPLLTMPTKYLPFEGRPDGPTISMGCRVSRTVFLAEDYVDIQIFLKYSNCLNSLNMAFPLSIKDYNSYISTNPINAVCLTGHQDEGVKRWHGANRVFMVGHGADMILPAVARALFFEMEQRQGGEWEVVERRRTVTRRRTGCACIELKAEDIPSWRILSHCT